MEILGCLELKIYNLLTQSNACLYRCNNIIKMIKDLKSLYTLKKYYMINLSLKDYHMQKTFVLQNYILKLLPGKIFNVIFLTRCNIHILIKNLQFIYNNLTDVKESDWTMTHKTIIKVAELLGLEKSYATLFMLKQMKNLNGLEQFVE